MSAPSTSGLSVELLLRVINVKYGYFTSLLFKTMASTFQALKRLRNDDGIVILPADKGRVTVVMNNTDYHDKMDELDNDKQTYEVLKRDLTPALKQKLKSKLLQLKKADVIDMRRYNRLRCPVPKPPKLYGLPKLHKLNVPMRPVVSFRGSPTNELSKYLTKILKPLTDESQHKLQSTCDKNLTTTN